MKFEQEWDTMGNEIQRMLIKLAEYIKEQDRKILARNARIERLTNQLTRYGHDVPD